MMMSYIVYRTLANNILLVILKKSEKFATIELDGEQDCRSGVNLASSDGDAVDFLFTNALPVAGILHILSNAFKDVCKAMPGWDRFIEGLKTLEGFILQTFARATFHCVVFGALASGLVQQKV